MDHKRKRGVLPIDGEDRRGSTIYDGRSRASELSEGAGENNLRPESKRFERVLRLVQQETLDFFDQQHVVIFGVGGVGSFAAESLARSGVGRITMVDFDCVCESNINRQLPALDTTVGRYKVDVLVERFATINPNATFVGHRAIFHAPTAEELLEGADFVVDAIDSVIAKTYLIATCHGRGIPFVSSMGAGGKFDPTRIRVVDLSKTYNDGLAREVRRSLRHDYGYDTSQHVGIPCIFSVEKRVRPHRLPGDDPVGPLPQGTLSCVTGAFGLAAASVTIQQMLQKKESLSQ